MAEAATLQIETPYDIYRLVDSIPEVYGARLVQRQQAENLLEERRIAYQQPTPTVEILLPVDALSTAHKVLESAETYGYGSAEHETRREGLVLDCRRLLGEWYRKKKPEYFPRARHIFDDATEDFFSHGLSIRQMTENALTPLPDDPEEESRRINERVEEATPQILRTVGCVALGVEKIRTISECTDTAIRDYQADMLSGQAHRGYRGYVPEIEKAMIRDIELDNATNDRYEEQLALPGEYIDHAVYQEVLTRRGAPVANMDKTELHGSQLLVKDDLMEFAEQLDNVGGEFWCVNLFMGEVVAPDYVKDYANFRQEALRRQESLKDMAEIVATYVLDLAASNFDRRQAPALVEEFVKKLLLNVAKQDTSVAEQMFDTHTLHGLQEVIYLESIGQTEAAFERMQQLEQTAPGGGYCGAGSCGLESVNLLSEAGKELAKKIKAEAGDTVLKDKVRSCNKCHSKTVIYAYNKRKVNKFCNTCSAFTSEKN